MFRVKFQHANKRRTHHRHAATISTNLPTSERSDNGDQDRDSNTGGECRQDGAGPGTAQTGLPGTTALGGRCFHRKSRRAQWHGFGIVGRLRGRGAPQARIPGARCRTAVAAKIKAGTAPSYLRSGLFVNGVRPMIVCPGDRGIFVLDRGARRASVHWRKRSRGFIQHTQKPRFLAQGAKPRKKPLKSKERGGEGKGWEWRGQEWKPGRLEVCLGLGGENACPLCP